MTSLKNFLIFQVVGLLTFSAFGVWATIALMSLKVGDPVPDFEIGTIDGKNVSPDSLKGKIIILAFWRMDQDNSKDVLSDLELLYREYQDRGVVVLAINADESSETEIKDFQTAHNLSYLFASDKGLTLYGRFGIIVLPSTLVIGPEGKLAHFQPIHGREFHSQLRAHLRFLLGEISSTQLEAELNPRKMPESSDARIKADRYLNLGLMLMDAGLLEKARDAFNTATETDPSLPEPHIYLAQIYSQEKDGKKTGEELGQALELLPKSKDNKLLQGISHASRGEDDLAMTFFQEVIKGNAEPPPEVYYQMGRIYERLNKPSEALESYQRTLKLLSKE
jgi:peroxiredoxin